MESGDLNAAGPFYSGDYRANRVTAGDPFATVISAYRPRPSADKETSRGTFFAPRGVPRSLPFLDERFLGNLVLKLRCKFFFFLSFFFV